MRKRSAIASMSLLSSVLLLCAGCGSETSLCVADIDNVCATGARFTRQ
ncbi:hypothetical protein ACF058_11420 [Streptomyces sp. NPDC015501]